MAFPVVAGTNSSFEGGFTANAVAALPASISAGDLLVVAFFTVTPITTPSGWTQIATANATYYLTVVAKVASGSEGSTLSAVQGAAGPSIHQSYRITGHGGLPTGEAVGGTNADPNPPNHSPGSAADYLWLAFGSSGDENGATLTGAPTSFTNLTINEVNSVQLGSARRELNASSLDPSAFTRTGGGPNVWQAATIAIAPAAAPSIAQSKYRFFEDGDELPHYDRTQPVIDSGDGTGTAITTAADPWSINHPAAASGDLLLWLLTWDDSTNVTTITPPSGPNGETISSIAGPIASSGTEIRQQAFHTIATGSWSAGTLSFDPNASETVVATCIKVPAGEFNASDPIGAAATRASAGTAESTVNSPAFTAEAGDTNGTLVILYGSDADAITAPGSDFTTVRNQTAGGVGHLVGVRNSAVSASESITALAASIASDSWCSLAFVVKPPVTADGRTPLAAVSTGIVRDTADPFGVQIRFENSGGALAEDTFKLQARLNGGSWFDVTGSSSVIRTVATADYADGDDALEYLLGSGTFVANNNAAIETDGEFVLAATLGSASAVEIHATLSIQDADVSDEDVIELRIVQQDGTAFDAYTVTPTIEVNKESGGVEEGVGAATGTATASAVGEATKAAAGAATGTSTAAATGAATKAAVGAAAGAASATAAGAANSAAAGSAEAAGAASATGASTNAAAGMATGTADAAAAGSSIAAAIGSAAADGSATAVGRSTAEAVGSASAAGSVLGVSDVLFPPAMRRQLNGLMHFPSVTPGW